MNRARQAILDNTDIVSHVYGAFDDDFVVNTKIHYEAGKNVSFDFGIDNLFNEQYFLFHPFPGRTCVMAGYYQFRCRMGGVTACQLLSAASETSDNCFVVEQ